MRHKGKAQLAYLVTLLLFLSITSYPRTLTAAESVETAGSIIAVLVPSVAYGATFHLHDKDGRNQFYKSFFTNVAVTWSLKQAVDKTRPVAHDILTLR